MSLSTYPDRYLTFNTQQTKTPAVVIKIDGLDLLTNTPIFTRIRYGDEGLVYGLPNIVYGGLRAVPGVRDILSLDSSSLTIGQKVEPEQGRASVSIMTLAFIDKDGYMSQAVAPGVLIPEILGARVRVYLGFQETSYPDDYFTVFRGYVTGVTSTPGLVVLQLSDPNVKRKQTVFLTAQNTLSAPINSSQLSIPITLTTDFHQQILGPDGTYDTGVKTYIKVDDEYMQYGPGGVSTGVITVATRGDRNTTAVSHDGGATVSAAVELTGDAMTLALKVMCSGFDGPFLVGQTLFSIRTTGDPVLGDQPRAVVLNVAFDAVDDLGIAIGDWITISGSMAGNDGTFQITEIGDWADLKNRVLYTSHTFNAEPGPITALCSIRSQFDTFPVTCGLGIISGDIDVATHVEVRDDFLDQDIYQFLIQKEENGKTWLENEIYLPEFAYSISRYGRLSVNLTVPPIASQELVVLDETNVLDPDQISVTRGTNNRRFFNDIQYQYDLQDDGQTFVSLLDLIDTDSLNVIGISSLLPIKSSGLRSSQSGALIAQRRGRFALVRYKNAAFEVTLKTNWQAGSLIETGDVVALVDDGNLKIVNFTTGERNLGTQLFEVIDRKLDIRSGNVQLTLLSNVGFDVTDRYATISPSSLVTSGSTATRVIIQESFGALFPLKEYKKWTDYIGLPVHVHSYDWSIEGQSVLTGFDSANDHMMILEPPLGFTPLSGYIVDIADYPSDTDPKTDELYKVIHAFVDPVATVVSGVSHTQFTVSSPDAALFELGLPVLLHNSDWSQISGEAIVVDITGTQITVKTSLGFTPSAGMAVELIGFPDLRGAFRIL